MREDESERNILETNETETKRKQMDQKQNLYRLHEQDMDIILVKKYDLNNKNMFRKGIHNNDDVRKWEKWSLKNYLSEYDTNNKASFMIDKSVYNYYNL